VAALDLKTRAHAALGQLDRAEETVAELEEIARVIDTDPLRATALVARGVLAAGAADHERARQCFEDAAPLFDQSGSPFESARARLGLAHALAGLGREPAAAAEAAAALATLEPMGAAAEARRARELMRRLEAPRPAGAGTPDGKRRRRGAGGLTPRERQVLALVAQGLSDREIACRLSLSEFTVHRHVSNILTRLGAASRAAAVAQALRSDLL
jgi:DNA-binding CsgD family transcriptional regulator